MAALVMVGSGVVMFGSGVVMFGSGLAVMPVVMPGQCLSAAINASNAGLAVS